MLNCIILDDEPMARKSLERLCAMNKKLQLASSFDTAESALEWLLANPGGADLIFLDVELPGMSGLQFLEHAPRIPGVIFTTSNAAYAFEAYENRAIDFLKKPIAIPRFEASVCKAVEVLKPSDRATFSLPNSPDLTGNKPQTLLSDQKPTVLLVDDSYAMTQFIGLFLAKKYEVKTCPNAESALQFFENADEPHVLVTDLEMPGMDGLEFIARVRRTRPDLPVIVVSGKKESQVRLNAFSAGADDFLTKPFQPVELEMRIGKLLERATSI